MNFRRLREKAKLSQTKMGEKLGVSQSTVAMWETGENMPRTSMLIKIAEVLNCTIDELLREEGE